MQLEDFQFEELLDYRFYAQVTGGNLRAAVDEWFSGFIIEPLGAQKRKLTDEEWLQFNDLWHTSAAERKHNLEIWMTQIWLENRKVQK